jgi:fibronectin-binding autotransporter adhesin
MAKPAITKRVTKGSALTYAELDTNFDNLKDATVTLTAGSGGTAVISDLNGNITLVAGTGISLAGNNTAKTVTITNSSPGSNSFETISVNGVTNVVADSNTDTLTLLASGSVTLTANAGADSITISSSASGVVNSGASGALAFYPSPGGATVDDTLITYSQAVGIQTLTSTNALALVSNDTVDIDAAGAIDFTPGLDDNISLNTTGTGAVSIGGLGALTAASVSNGGSGVRIDGGGTIGITNATNADIYITPVGTGKLIVANDINIGKSTAGVTVLSNWNDTNTFILLKNRNASGVAQIEIKNNNVEISAGTATHTGDIVLKTGGSGRSVAVGDGTNQALITSAIPTVGTSDLKVAAGTGGAIVLGSATDSNITVTPNGTGKTVIGNLVATETIVANGNTGAATLTPNAALGAVQSYTVTGNITFSAFGTPLAGQSLTLILTQDGTGSRLLTSTMKFAGGSKTLSTAANAVDIITVYYDGTTYWASLSKGFA